MKHITQFWVTIVFFLAFAGAQAAYRLGTGDEINVQVYDEPDLSFSSILIDGSGRFSFPFVGEVFVKGKTPSEVEATLIRALKPDYLVNPKITVSIAKFRPFYINGEVKSPGGIAYQPGLNLRKAVTLAGGFTERASRSGIYVIREGDEKKKGRKVGLDYEVLPGDVITVEQSFF